MDLTSILQPYASNMDPQLVVLLSKVLEACGDIAEVLRLGSSFEQAGTQNRFGDNQLEVDLATDKIVFDRLRESGAVSIASSEETPSENDLGGEGYSVAFDPLDGSSIIDANFAVGSIFGIWPGRGLLGRTGREQVASVVAQYGPRATAAVALGPSIAGGPHGVALEVTLLPGGGAAAAAAAAAAGGEEVREGGGGGVGVRLSGARRLAVVPAGRTFAPGNLRAISDNPRYSQLVQHWIKERYTLRYTGGLVPDIYHILTKGKGVFANVSSPSAIAKLRLLYECAPIALLVEAAGGASCLAPPPDYNPDEGPGAGVSSVLDASVSDLDRRVGVCYGGAEEVAAFRRFMFGGGEEGGAGEGRGAGRQREEEGEGGDREREVVVGGGC